ncbi:MAG: DUF342 domain-containing protein, partial [Gemmatimonadetes bacterium]|nr:DUF342 domain-containing protein [Gemmatimonadota bacterium]
MSEETHGIPEIDDGLEDLDGLKELLAEEGVAGDDDWSPEDLLEEADADEDDSSPVDHSSSKRSKRRGGRDRHRDDEQAFRDLDSQLTAETLELKIDEDHLIVTVGRLGQENTIEEVRDELRRHKILAELDEKTVTVALQRAASGRPQYDVVAARGTPAIVHTHSHLRFHLPDALTVDDPQPLAALQQAVGGPSLDVVEAWEGPVHVVHAGDVMVDIAAAEYEEGCDVYGQPILPEVDELPPLPHGDYTKLTADGQAVVATHYGYGGVIGNEPTVVSPIFVSSDSMEVHFVVIKGEAMPAPTPEELKAVLEVRWVEKGIDDEAIHRLCQELDTGKALQKRSHLVAQGIPPSPGVDGEIKYDTAPSSLVRWKDLDSLRKARDQDELVVAVGEMQGSGRALIAVHAGDELATRKPAIEGLPGSDIRGEELPAEEGENVELDAGLNTEVDAEGVVLKATQFGLVAVYGSEQLSVVPPVWIATDKQSLCFLNLHQGEQPVLPTAAELSESIETDVDLSAWDGIRSQLEAGELTDPIIPIIQGTVPVPGEDGRFEWAIKVGGRAGKILDDGSIDLRDRRLITVAQPGDLLGSSYVAKPGSPGVDVFGAELSPPPACDIEVVCDARIEARPQDEGRIDYHAVEQGGVTFTEESRRKRGIPVRRLRLSLFAVSEISGDVDYSTGHVDFRGDVVIGGSVKPLFRVKATGSVTIGGNVEPGAYIEAGGDVAVGGGIMGDRTVIQAGSGVQAKFIEQARVTCGGDV